MEHCPHCDAPGREGAKYCTSCGYRMLDDEDLVMVNAMSASSPPMDDADAMRPADLAAAGWPAPPAPSPASGVWPVEPASDPPLLNSAAEEPAYPFWEGALGAWPEPRIATEPEEPVQDGSEAPPEAADVTGAEELSTDARARANQLLDELRAVVAALDSGASTDLSGVISDLEVAATPPGALVAEDLADLREALLAAREKPREIDTMLDLSRRIDAMVALVIAYDRTIAAIERSLDILRRA